MIPFDVSIPKYKQDKNLYDKFINFELPGILAWAVKGCLEWQSKGLKPSKEVLDALKRYRAEAEVVHAFIQEQCRVGEKLFVPFGDLFEEWKNWCQGNEVDAGTGKNFAMILNEKRFEGDLVRVDGESRRVRKGISLRPIRDIEAMMESLREQAEHSYKHREKK